jgi:hypothetical protein
LLINNKDLSRERRHELTDEQWKMIEGLFAKEKEKGKTPNRESTERKIECFKNRMHKGGFYPNGMVPMLLVREAETMGERWDMEAGLA